MKNNDFNPEWDKIFNFFFIQNKIKIEQTNHIIEIIFLKPENYKNIVVSSNVNIIAGVINTEQTLTFEKSINKYIHYMSESINKTEYDKIVQAFKIALNKAHEFSFDIPYDDKYILNLIWSFYLPIKDILLDDNDNIQFLLDIIVMITKLIYGINKIAKNLNSYQTSSCVEFELLHFSKFIDIDPTTNDFNFHYYDTAYDIYYLEKQYKALSERIKKKCVFSTLLYLIFVTYHSIFEQYKLAQLRLYRIIKPTNTDLDSTLYYHLTTKIQNVINDKNINTLFRNSYYFTTLISFYTEYFFVDYMMTFSKAMLKNLSNKKLMHMILNYKTSKTYILDSSFPEQTKGNYETKYTFLYYNTTQNNQLIKYNGFFMTVNKSINTDNTNLINVNKLNKKKNVDKFICFLLSRSLNKLNKLNKPETMINLLLNYKKKYIPFDTKLTKFIKSEKQIANKEKLKQPQHLDLKNKINKGLIIDVISMLSELEDELYLEQEKNKYVNNFNNNDKIINISNIAAIKYQNIQKYIDYYNFTGNFVWVRGVVIIEAGTVNSILYNH